MTQIVLSKLQGDTQYTLRVGDTVRRVLVRGHTRIIPGYLAPTTTDTVVSDADAEFLSEHKQFRQHAARGFVKIVRD
jgi:hypothetical protein